jgi:hypothetical protein
VEDEALLEGGAVTAQGLAAILKTLNTCIAQAELEWSVTFEPDGLPESEAVALLEGALAANCLALKQVLERHGIAA